MPPSASSPTPNRATDLAALCHRLGSPLGALVNHLALMDMDRGDLPEPVRTSLDAARRASEALGRTLAAARAWMEAHERTLRPGAVDAAEVERSLGWRPPHATGVAVDPEAWAQLVADLLADGRLASAETQDDALVLRFLGLPERGIEPSRGEAALDPFGASGTAPRWASARILTERLGGRWAFRDDGNGTACAIVRLPLTWLREATGG